jgi:hypothetical protein
VKQTISEIQARRFLDYYWPDGQLAIAVRTRRERLKKEPERISEGFPFFIALPGAETDGFTQRDTVWVNTGQLVRCSEEVLLLSKDDEDLMVI